ncbi:MAG: hemolysin III family protein, partial [Candidatus Methylomirabilales bacterium]
MFAISGARPGLVRSLGVRGMSRNGRAACDPGLSGLREQSRGEEFANTLSHGIGLFAAAAAVPTLFAGSVSTNPKAVVGNAIFSTTLLLLYLVSALYHALPPGRSKHICRLLDHQAIFLVIAGTYTPFTLGVLWGPWGWMLLGVIWSAALAGITLKAAVGLRHPGVSMALYLGMGWLVLVAVEPLSQGMPAAGL